jgi:hypothetical protein
MSVKFLSLLGLATLFLTTQLHAEEESNAAFGIQWPLARFVQTNEKTTGAQEESTSEFATQPGGGAAFLSARVGNTTLYVYPFDKSNDFFSLSYMVTPDVELGLDLGFNTLRHKNEKTSHDSSMLGGWAFYYGSLGIFGTETGLVYDYTETKDRTSNDDAITTVDKQNNFLKFSYSLTYAITKNLKWNFGPYVSMETTQQKGGPKTDATHLGFMLANLRWKW